MRGGSVKGTRFFKIAVVYFVIAILLGLLMGILHDFSLTSVHAHLNLLGWVSMVLFGAIDHFYPDASKNGLAVSHFCFIISVCRQCRAASWQWCSPETNL